MDLTKRECEMSKLNRRQAIQAAALAPWAWHLGESGLHGCESVADLRIATFRFDVTPPWPFMLWRLDQTGGGGRRLIGGHWLCHSWA